MQETLDYTLYAQRYDCIVVGGGTAGIMAACAAARENQRVLIVERSYSLGGTITQALVVPRMTNHIDGFFSNCSLIKPIQREMELDGFAGDDYFADPQMQKLYFERLCLRCGVSILYGQELVSAKVKDGRIAHILCSGRAGLTAYAARVYIDCTGDARLSAICGCPCSIGDPQGRNQPMTFRFVLSGVNVPLVERTLLNWGYSFGGDHFPMEFYSLWREEAFNPFTNLLRRGVESGELTERDGSYVQAFYHPSLGRDTLYMNCPEAGHIGDAISDASVTEMVLYSRQAAHRLTAFLKKHFPGFEECRISAFSEMPGIRESRSIAGAFILTEADVAARRRFDDAIAQTAYPIDIHDEKNLTLIHMNPGEFYEIPYRCLLPQGVGNLLTAGRCISTSFAVQASVRIQLTCMATGEAAGIAAAMSDTPSEVNGADVRERMRQYGATFL